jgi:hypothetical protein
MSQYEINVSRNGKHFFATHERSFGLSKKHTREVYDKLVEAFPANEGYMIEIRYCQTTSQLVKPNELLDD